MDESSFGKSAELFCSQTLKHWGLALSGATASVVGWLLVAFEIQRIPAYLFVVVGGVLLLLAMFRAFHDLRLDRDRLKATYGPNLRPLQPEAFFLNIAEVNGPVNSYGVLYSIPFLNDPESPTDAAVARDVLADVSYFQDGRHVLDVRGRWDQTDQPSILQLKDPFATTIHLDTITIKIGQTRKLNLITRIPVQGKKYCCYAFSNESYSVGFEHERFHLNADDWHVHIRLRGPGIEGNYSFLFKDAGSEKPELTIHTSSPRP